MFVGFFPFHLVYLFIYLFKYSILCPFQPVLHDWCNKDRGMCYPVCGMVHIKEPLLLIGNCSPCSSLSDWYFTICPTPYNHK